MTRRDSFSTDSRPYSLVTAPLRKHFHHAASFRNYFSLLIGWWSLNRCRWIMTMSWIESCLCNTTTSEKFSKSQVSFQERDWSNPCSHMHTGTNTDLHRSIVYLWKWVQPISNDSFVLEANFFLIQKTEVFWRSMRDWIVVGEAFFSKR